jgi:hypothetical protein
MATSGSGKEKPAGMIPTTVELTPPRADSLAHDSRIRSELIAPELMAQHRDGCSAGSVLLGKKSLPAAGGTPRTLRTPLETRAV